MLASVLSLTVQTTEYTECQAFSPVVRNRPPPPASECCPPHHLVPGGTHSLAGEGAGGANSDEGTGTLVL
jgi:hypothetical protein